VHGGGSSFTTGSPEEGAAAAHFHRGHGTTTLLASLVTAPVPDLLRQISALAELVDDEIVAGLLLKGRSCHRNVVAPTLRTSCGPQREGRSRRCSTADPAPSAWRPWLRSWTAASTPSPSWSRRGVLPAIGHTEAPSESVCELGQRVRRLLSCQVAAVQIMASWVAGRVS